MKSLIKSELQVSRMRLLNIRQFAEMEISAFDPRLNVIVGPNTCGKTTLLEALSVFSHLESFRSRDQEDLIRMGEEAGSISVAVEKPTATELVIGYRQKERLLRVDGEKISRSAYPFLGTSVSFVPDDLLMIKGEPERRRDFMDQLSGHIWSVYRDEQKRFEKLLSHRNRILRQLKDSLKNLSSSVHTHEQELSLWTEQYVEAALVIYQRRLQLVQLLKEWVPQLYRNLFGADEVSDIRYVSSLDLSGDLRAAVFQRLQERAEAERALGYTVVGPHRDDFQLFLNGHEARNFGSQGQIRGIVIALKIFELEQARTYQPILLLDDIISELDDRRVRVLVDYLATYPGQLFVSTAEVQKLETLHKQFPSFKLIDLKRSPQTRDSVTYA